MSNYQVTKNDLRKILAQRLLHENKYKSKLKFKYKSKYEEKYETRYINKSIDKIISIFEFNKNDFEKKNYSHLSEHIPKFYIDELKKDLNNDLNNHPISI